MMASDGYPGLKVANGRDGYTQVDTTNAMDRPAYDETSMHKVR